MRTVICLILGLALVGCGWRGPQPVTPLSPPPATFAGSVTAGEVQTEPWWQAFADPDLERLIAEAFAGNLDLEQSLARLRQAEALLGSANAGRLPSLTGNGEFKRAGQPTAGGDLVGESRSLSLAASFELDLFGKQAARSRGARADRQSAAASSRALLLSLSARVADAYYLVIEQRMQLRLASDNVAAYEKSLAMVERRYRSGLVPAVDLYQARQTLASGEALRAATAGALQQAEHALAVLVGRYPGEELPLQLQALPTPPAMFPAGLPSQLLNRRPDLVAALHKVEASDARLAAALADRFPSINLLGTYGDSRSTLTGPVVSGEFWSLAGGLALPLLDGGRRRAEVDRQRAVYDESLAAYRQTVLTAFQEVEDALSRNEHDALRIASLSAAEAASQSALRLADQRYRLGLSDYLPVLTAQVANAQIKSNLLAARRQLLADRISLARALGGDWMAATLSSLAAIKEPTP